MNQQNEVQNPLPPTDIALLFFMKIPTKAIWLVDTGINVMKIVHDEFYEKVQSLLIRWWYAITWPTEEDIGYYFIINF